MEKHGRVRRKVWHEPRRGVVFLCECEASEARDTSTFTWLGGPAGEEGCRRASQLPRGRRRRGWRGGPAVWLEEQGWRRRVAGLELGEGEGQYGQRRHCSGVAPFDKDIFANPFA
jgi:hypothetical protein